MYNFWQQLNKPIFCLAPMEEVTDFAFREMFARYSSVSLRGSASDRSNLNYETYDRIASSPDKAPASRNDTYNQFVMFTEFINVDGLTHPEGRKKLEIDLKYSEAQRPIVAQLWGRNPEKFSEAAKIIVDLGFDGIDINFGCPQAKEIAGGTCAALIREPALAQDIIRAVKKAAGDLPVSVKTRLGYSKADEMAGWVTTLLETGIAALTLHGRTKQEMSKVPAQWEKIAEAVAIRDKFQIPNSKFQKTLIIGNGDIKSREEGLQRVAETNVDGVMVARGAFGCPWFFNPNIEISPPVAQARALPTSEIMPQEKEAGGLRNISPQEKLRVMLEHAELFDRELGQYKNFVIMRKHFKAYCSGFPGAHELRAKLMETKNLEETRIIVEEYLMDIDGY
ncbi:MAG: tRNA-dihydrouridine synthase [Candidatus Doudnabacteria bacterium]|nr:tRNA-dihydrouridine synthase [Candidatus Doudnabacteria bacterium]